MPNTPAKRLLSRARIETERIVPGFGGGGIGAPVLVAGGALIPVVASVSQYLGAIDFLAPGVIAALFGVIIVVFLLLSTLLLSGAGLARRRCDLILRQPLAALWETIGNAGDPPEDNSRLFASVAIVLSAIVWVAVPVLGGILYAIAEL